jgi:hypothetical protein
LELACTLQKEGENRRANCNGSSLGTGAGWLFTHDLPSLLLDRNYSQVSQMDIGMWIGLV